MCHNCESPNFSVVCHGCRLANYCSEECAAEHWSDCHKYDCDNIDGHHVTMNERNSASTLREELDIQLDVYRMESMPAPEVRKTQTPLCGEILSLPAPRK